MRARYRTTFNPATGEHIQYTVTGLESHGALVRYCWTSDPGGKIVEHTHPSCAEVYTILEGEAELTVGSERITLGPGQTAVVPPGVMHSEANNSGTLVRGIVELQPASRTAELHDALAGVCPTRAAWDSRLPADAPAPEPLFDEAAYRSQLTQAGYTFPLTDPQPWKHA